MKTQLTPWHVTLPDSDQAHHHLTVEPKDEEADELTLRMTSDKQSVIAITTDSEDLSQFCRTVLAILEERGLVGEDDDD